MGIYRAFNNPRHGPIQFWLGIPLIAGEQVIEIFAVDHAQPDFFSGVVTKHGFRVAFGDYTR